MKKLSPSLIRPKVTYVISRFIGYGFGGGGAEKKMETLITYMLKNNLGIVPNIFVSHPADSVGNLQVEGYDNKTANSLDQYIHSFSHGSPENLLTTSSPDTVLHLFDSSLVLYDPEKFLEISERWEGPIIQRITLLQRVHQLADAHPSDLLKYTNNIDAFISQTEEISEALLNAGIPRQKIVHIDYGIDPNMYHPLGNSDEKNGLRSEIFPWLSPNKLAYIFSGRLTDPNKRILQLIDEWEKSRLWEDGHYLILVGQHRRGDALENDPLVMLVRSATYGKPNLYNIVITGLLDSKEIARYYQAADIYVTPSVNEALSYSLLEAMASALPVIARKGTCGNSRVIKESETGVYFDDHLSLGTQMRNMCSIPNRVEMGTNAQAIILDQYTIQQTAHSYLNLYRELIASKLARNES